MKIQKRVLAPNFIVLMCLAIVGAALVGSCSKHDENSNSVTGPNNEINHDSAAFSKIDQQAISKAGELDKNARLYERDKAEVLKPFEVVTTASGNVLEFVDVNIDGVSFGLSLIHI